MQRQLRWVGHIIRIECHQTVCLDASSTLSFRKAVAPVVARWNVFPTTSSYCWRNARYHPVSSRHSPLIDLCGVTSVKMVLPQSLSTTIRRQKLAGFVATPSPRRRQLVHAATSVIESVPQISDCAVIYASTIVHSQLASTASSSTSTDSYKQVTYPFIFFHFFLSSLLQKLLDVSYRRVFSQGCARWGEKNPNLIFIWFIRKKNENNTMAPI